MRARKMRVRLDLTKPRPYANDVYFADEQWNQVVGTSPITFR